MKGTFHRQADSSQKKWTTGWPFEIQGNVFLAPFTAPLWSLQVRATNDPASKILFPAWRLLNLELWYSRKIYKDAISTAWNLSSTHQFRTYLSSQNQKLATSYSHSLETTIASRNQNHKIQDVHQDLRCSFRCHCRPFCSRRVC